MATKKIRRIVDIGTVIQAIYADSAGVIRIAQAGLDLAPIGALDAAVRVGENTPVLVFNSAGAVAFVTFGDQSVAAPGTAANGIPIPAGQTVMLNSGAKAWIRASASTVFGYAADQC